MLLESLPVALIVGTVLGFLTGLGVGGGSLLILWLTLVLEMPQTAARGINLLFFLPSAMIACYLRWKQGAVTLRKVLPAILTGCAAAAVFSLISTRMDLDILKKLFGVLLDGNPGTVLPAKVIVQPFRFLYARYPSRISDAATASTVSFRFFP